MMKFLGRQPGAEQLTTEVLGMRDRILAIQERRSELERLFDSCCITDDQLADPEAGISTTYYMATEADCASADIMILYDEEEYCTAEMTLLCVLGQPLPSPGVSPTSLRSGRVVDIP